ncbi:hypothetical protein INT45_004056 [Circinella minor]|uniref:C2H2-type domain-containing protein n=1 Tax=Circinella minor TaxID=1195481 RepID=A0A8H7S3N2_9FUNG|nr:hypothetical protein INT45_004056 [Circinella minor]
MHIQDLFSFFTPQTKAKDMSTSQSVVSPNQHQQQVEYCFHHRNRTTENIINNADQSQCFNKIENGLPAPISLIPTQTIPPNANRSYYYGSLWGEDEEGGNSSSYSTLASTPSSITQFSPFPVGDSFFSTASTAPNCFRGSGSPCSSADDKINSISVHSDIMTNMSSSLSIAGQSETFDYDQLRQDSLMDTATNHISTTQQPSENYGCNLEYNKKALQDITQQNQPSFTFHDDNKQSADDIYPANNEYAPALVASLNIVSKNDAIRPSKISQCENDLSYLPYFIDEQEVESTSKNSDDNVEHNSQEFSSSSWSARNQEPSVSLLSANNEEGHKRRRLSPTTLSWSLSAASSLGTKNSLISVESEKCCGICGSSFSRSRDRKRHEDSVHGEFLLYQCDLCDTF